MIELRHLRYFVAVAEELHYGRAARRLNMAQSPLSHQIRQLERELGTDLIVRGHHVVGLTEPGKVLLRSARAILDDVERAVRLCQQAARRDTRTLVLGYLPESAELLPAAIKQYRARFPEVDLELEEHPAATLLAQLAEGGVDVAFVRSPLAAGSLAFEPLVSETLVLVAPVGAPLRAGPIALAELADQPFVLPAGAAAPGLRRDIEAAFATAGFVPRAGREASPLSGVLVMVAAGAGVALLPPSAVRRHALVDVEFRELRPPAPTTTAGMAWRPGDTWAPLDGFLRAARQAASASVTPSGAVPGADPPAPR